MFYLDFVVQNRKFVEFISEFFIHNFTELIVIVLKEKPREW